MMRLDVRTSSCGSTLPKTCFASREATTFEIFWRGVSPVKLIRASLAFQSTESAGRLFSVWCSSACRSTCKLCDLKSYAQIPDQGLFCACPVSNGTGRGNFSLGEAGRKIRLLFVNSLARSSFVSRAPSVIDISCLVTGLVTVNGNRESCGGLVLSRFRHAKESLGRLRAPDSRCQSIIRLLTESHELTFSRPDCIKIWIEQPMLHCTAKLPARFAVNLTS